MAETETDPPHSTMMDIRDVKQGQMLEAKVKAKSSRPRPNAEVWN